MTRPDTRDEHETLAEEHAVALAKVQELEAEIERLHAKWDEVERGYLDMAVYHKRAYEDTQLDLFDALDWLGGAVDRVEQTEAALRVYAYGREGHDSYEVARAALGPAEVNPERCPCGKGPVDWGGLCTACWEEEKLEHEEFTRAEGIRCGFGLSLPEKEPPKPPAVVSLGAYLRACRLQAGLTLGKLRDATGIGLTRLSDLERGRAVPTAEEVASLLGPLGFIADFRAHYLLGNLLVVARKDGGAAR